VNRGFGTWTETPGASSIESGISRQSSLDFHAKKIS